MVGLSLDVDNGGDCPYSSGDLIIHFTLYYYNNTFEMIAFIHAHTAPLS